MRSLCAEFHGLGLTGLTISPQETAGPGALTVAPGWALRGGETRSQLEQAHAILTRQLEAELDIQSLCSEILERYEEVSLVYRLATKLGTVVGEDALAQGVLDDAARVLGAENAELWLHDDGGPRLAAVLPEQPRPTALDEGPRRAWDTGSTWTREARSGQCAAVAVPVPGPEDRPVGVIVLRGRSAGRSYRSGEVKQLTALAVLTSAFIGNIRQSELVRRDEECRRRDELARQVHHSLLPAEEPRVAGLDVAGCCLSADAIGGDYYGYFNHPQRGLGVAIADVSGHGVGAALYMAAVKGSFKTEARRGLPPADLLTRANLALEEELAASQVFATAFFARFDPNARGMVYANGGHNPPLLVRATGAVEKLVPKGPALGLRRDAEYGQASAPFDVDDLLILYTDGLIEARDADQRFYGLESLTRKVVELRGRSAGTIRDELIRTMRRHVAEQPQRDDVTLVVIRGVASPEAGR